MLFHPYVIDTSVIYNLKGRRCFKSKLKVLTENLLAREIQTGNDGHCSFEDAKASLDLALLKLSKGIAFGDVILNWRPEEVFVEDTRPAKRPKLEIKPFKKPEIKSKRDKKPAQESKENKTLGKKKTEIPFIEPPKKYKQKFNFELQVSGVSPYEDIEKVLKYPMEDLNSNDHLYLQSFKQQFFTSCVGDTTYAHVAEDLLKQCDTNFELWPCLNDKEVEHDEKTADETIRPQIVHQPKMKYTEVLADRAKNNKLIVSNLKSKKSSVEERQKDYRDFARKYFDCLSGLNMVILIAGGCGYNGDNSRNLCRVHIAVKDTKRPRVILKS